MIGDWDAWRFILRGPDGVLTGQAMSSEAMAIDDAAAALVRAYPCGLTYTLVDAAYTESGKTLEWTSREEATRMAFAGYPGANNCTGHQQEINGRVTIRRERKVRCPRGYGWLMRDNQPAICIKD